jgi:hypothetical protein
MSPPEGLTLQGSAVYLLSELSKELFLTILRLQGLGIAHRCEEKEQDKF